jgi:hypothetical protein
LHHYLTNSETVNGVPGFFDQYYNEVNQASFGFPQTVGLRKIVMISGSDLGVPQTFGTACQLATNLEAKYRPRKLLAVLFYSPLAAITSAFFRSMYYFKSDCRYWPRRYKENLCTILEQYKFGYGSRRFLPGIQGI